LQVVVAGQRSIEENMLRPFESTDATQVASIWNAACGPDLAITPRFVEYNMRPTTGAVQAGRLAMQAGEPAGFVLATALPASPDVSPPQYGWIDAVAVLPAFQKRGLGGELLAWAEDWLRQHGCTRARLGGGLRPWTPGLPVELHNGDYFYRCGYAGRSSDSVDWDVAHDLRDYARPVPDLQSAISIRPGQPGDEDALANFLRREFPNRWRFEFDEFRREHGRLADYVLLWTERGVDGFARLTFEDSERPIERFYMHRLPRPWGQLGPIGVSAACRGKGYGGALLDAGLRHLRGHGVRGCVIDWTDLVVFYGKFGFRPYRQYAMLLKSFDSEAKNV
jgi:GNAT superfamily N-acetyltransferase